MARKEELRARLLATFRVEALEHVQAIAHDVEVLARAASEPERAESLENAFRVMHTLKGAARSVNLAEIEALAQDCELMLSGVKQGRRTIDETLMRDLQAAADKIRTLVEMGLSPAAPPGAPVAAMPPRTDTIRTATAKLDALLRETEDLLGLKLAIAERAVQARGVAAALAATRRDLHKRTGGGRLDARSLRAIEAEARQLAAALDADRRTASSLVTELQSQARGLRMSPEGKAAERTDTITAAAERCARIVGSFLALARQRPIEKVRMSLNDAVQQALELVAYPLRVDSIELTTDLKRDLPILWADPHQIHQVIVNLVTNAQHALRRRPGAKGVIVRTRRVSGKAAALEVEDNGPGIPPEIRDRVFEPFFTTKAPGEGTGLGLSLCRSIVEKHGGMLSMETESGRGTLFRVELPVGQAGVERRVETTPADDAAPAPSCRILIVDDEEALLAVLADLVGEQGHSVATAENGAAALRKLDSERFDLVLTDMRMPELDGPGLYQAACERHPEMKDRFVFLTGDSFSPTTARFLEETSCPKLAKPFQGDELRRLLGGLARSIR